MRSTGEVMGIDRSFGLAFAKSQTAAGNRLPDAGHGVPLARRPRQGRRAWSAARRFAELGLRDRGHRRHRRPRSRPRGSIAEAVVGRLTDGDGADGVDAVDLISSGKVDLVVNTPRGRGPRADGAHIRRTATARGIPCVTTVAAALAASAGIVEWATPRGHGPLAAGVPPRRPAPARRSEPCAVAPTDGSTRRHARTRSSSPNPIVAASGTFGHGDEVARLGDPARLGAVTAKSRRRVRRGRASPRRACT